MRLLRLVTLVALAASAAEYVDYSQAESAFCAGLGCGAVKHSGWGYFGHRYLSVPLVGVLGFGGLLGVSLARAARGEGNQGLPGWAFLGLVGLAVGATVRFGRTRSDGRPG